MIDKAVSNCTNPNKRAAIEAALLFGPGKVTCRSSGGAVEKIKMKRANWRDKGFCADFCSVDFPVRAIGESPPVMIRKKPLGHSVPSGVKLAPWPGFELTYRET